MRIKVNEASGIALDWMVAKCVEADEGMCSALGLFTTTTRKIKFSTDRIYGGLIIERERISVMSDYHEIKEGWFAEGYDNGVQAFGATPLIAGMRCYVASELGEEADIPEELCEK